MEKESRRLGALILTGLFLLASLDGFRLVGAISVTVLERECVYDYVFYEGDHVSGNFVVVDHDIFWGADHPGLDFEVTSPAGNVVYHLKGKSGEKFEFKAPTPGMYKFCFINPSSAPETVSFYIHVGHIPDASNVAAKDEHLTPINVKIALLKESLENVTSEQIYLKARESRHRHTNESTRKRLIFYTFGEYLALACVSGLQVFYIRRLFSKSVGYNRV
ncbi:emp24/gp25L/p24 family/GOLD family protein [Wolffia australiana]